MTKLFTTALLLVSLGTVGLSGCTTKKADATPAPAATVGTLTVDVENMVGPDPLTLDTRSYTSPAGQPFTVSSFRYYLSNLKLLRADSSEYAVPESYFLIRETGPGDTRPSGKHFVLDNVPVGEYIGLSFLIGVDEERNSAGAQTGALDPNNGMFWTWSQGYIFLAMEGSSPQSGDQTSHLLAYHVGGVQAPNTLRVVAPPLPAGASIRVQGGHAPAITLRTNLLRLFEGRYPVAFGTDYFAVGGFAANKIATNYSGSLARSVAGTNSMFTVAQVRSN
jgi:hypothetical protein